ncbi:MPPV-236 N1R/p28 gene family protein [Magpiepox virus 2]|nr:MPPV-236 N1R/p28 gene family protein [Magpiepox virus 2]
MFSFSIISSEISYFYITETLVDFTSNEIGEVHDDVITRYLSYSIILIKSIKYIYVLSPGLVNRYITPLLRNFLNHIT